MPECLAGAARDHWQYIVPRLIARRTLSPSDAGLLMMMCVEYAEYLDAVAAMADVKKRIGSKEASAIRRVMQGSFERYSKAAVQFGLSPASKARVVATPIERKKKVAVGPMLRIAR